MAEITLISPNIHCESCAASVKKVLLALPGVQSVSVNVDEKTVRVIFQPPTSDGEVKRTLTEAGFPITEEI
jgi:copper chaperone CopZ